MSQKKITVQDKLQIIQKSLGVSQTKLAEHFNVSFVAFNSWWNGKATPRAKALVAIDDLYMEVTGQKKVSSEHLVLRKKELSKSASKYGSIIKEILNSPDIKDQFVLKLTYNSNSIEGSTMTEPDTAAVIFDNIALPNRSFIEQLEAKNHQAALDFLFKHVAEKGELNDNFILRLHGIVMNGIRDDAGSYRRHAVRIVGVNLPTANYLKIPELMPEILGIARNKTKDIIALASTVHSRFEQIHPFSDGNGRVGRLLLNAMLLSSNIAPAVILQEQKKLYYTYLFKAQTGDDQSQLENFICDAVSNGFSILERK